MDYVMICYRVAFVLGTLVNGILRWGVAVVLGVVVVVVVVDEGSR
jgi:hypothetical protein